MRRRQVSHSHARLCGDAHLDSGTHSVIRSVIKGHSPTDFPADREWPALCLSGLVLIDNRVGMLPPLAAWRLHWSMPYGFRWPW